MWGTRLLVAVLVCGAHGLAPPQQPLVFPKYHNEKVVRITEDPKNVLSVLASANNITYQKWGSSASERFVDIHVDEDNHAVLQSFSWSCQVIIENLADAIAETMPQHQDPVVETTQAHPLSEIFFREYRPLETIDAWLGILQQTFPDIVSVEEIGQTYEHRPLKIVHISRPSDIDHGKRKTVVVTGGTHAREWVSVSSVCYAIYSLLQLYLEEPNKISDQLDFLFIPVMNPDGYAYTWTEDRLWKKNRQETHLPKCFGIDIDHSFEFHWTRSSDWACGEEYSGESPFEALEARMWHQYLNSTNDDHNIYGYIDLHSYSQEVLYPYAFSCSEQPRDEENLIELAYGISKTIRRQSGKNYNVLPACIDKDSDLLPDLGSGSALDFMYHNRAYWAYQLKLRDSGSHGFLLPSKYIEPVGREVAAAIYYFCTFILSDE
ncbi:putative metallocarboxypeptidase ECM14 [Meyerozyma sp. JA9]|nr:putative metallocarboxypeptidase ECM14 [Meyerozyma sp. JA9]